MYETMSQKNATIMTCYVPIIHHPDGTTRGVDRPVERVHPSGRPRPVKRPPPHPAPPTGTRSTVHSDLCDKRGSHKSPMHRGPQGVIPWRAPGTMRPRQLSHKSPREPEICSGKESEAVRATRKEEGRGVRAKACGARAVGCSSIMCRQPVARVQRTTPRRKPVGDFYLPKTGRRGPTVH